MNKMKQISIFLLLLFVCLVMPSYAIAEDKSNNSVKKLKWLESAKPEVDAKKAIIQKDFRLRAIYGYVLMIPGVNQKNWIKYENKYGVNPIEGTSDNLINDEHARLQKLASEYALKYNKMILNYKKR
jgi:hypothetical protein